MAANEQATERADVREARGRLDKAAAAEVVPIPMEEYRALIGLRDVVGQYLEIKLGGGQTPEVIVPARLAVKKSYEHAMAQSPHVRMARGDA